MEGERGERPDGGDGAGLALLLLLPAAALAWPWPQLLAGDPEPHLAGAGILALASVPATAWLAFRIGGIRGFRRPPGFAALLVALLSGAAVALAAETPDALELRRAAAWACAAPVLLLGGAALGPRGRRIFAGGLVVLAIAFAGHALAKGGALAGTLANTGALSQAALPGAVVGALLAACAPLALAGLLGGAAFLLFAVHAAAAPSIASALAAAAALGLAALLSRRARARPRAALVALALLPPALLVLWRALPTEESDAAPVAARLAAETGGFEVRARLWASLGPLLADRPLTGLGPGQVRALYAEWRDPEEIRLSSHGSCADHPTAVDHLHSDLLEAAAETGLPGGLAWALFLALAAAAALESGSGARLAFPGFARKHGESEKREAGSGSAFAVLALLGVALVHSPLYVHPASAALGFAAIGALAPAGRRRGPGGLARVLVAVLAVGGVVAAVPLVRHGRALADAWGAAAELDLLARSGAPDPADAEAAEARLRRGVERALEAAPSSAPAHSLAARVLAAEERAGEARIHWRAVLAARPRDVEALQELARLSAELGERDEARELWSDALALDPGHPRVLRNLVRLALAEGELDRARAHLDALAATGCLEAAFVEGLGEELLLAGRPEAGLALLARADARLDPTRPDGLLELAREAAAAGRDRRAAALEAAAHQLWAREHLLQGAPATAVRSYRQALRPTRRDHPDGAPLLRLELAAAHVQAGDPAAAREEAAGLAPAERELALLPEWARDALAEADLAPLQGRR